MLPSAMRMLRVACLALLIVGCHGPGAGGPAAPAAGLVAVGSPGDLVVLDDDPARDVRALARVRYTMRGGRIIYESEK
jgi:predicted amidohydrolase YtcJ